MKFSKSAMKARHVQLGHMTMMQPTAFSPEKAESAERPRIYSTDRHTPSNNGIVIPHQLRERIVASMPAARPEPPRAAPDGVFMAKSWGFL